MTRLVGDQLKGSTIKVISCAIISHIQKADLHLCFGICKSRFSHVAAHIKSIHKAKTKALISCAVLQLISAIDLAYAESGFLMTRLIQSLSVFTIIMLTCPHHLAVFGFVCVEV